MYYTLQLLTALLTNSSQRLQEAILNIPRGITQANGYAHGSRGAFEKILSIIRGEGNSDGGVVVQRGSAFSFTQQKQIVDIGKTLPLFMELQTLGDRM
nr:golgin candidate 6 isoform X2 [Arachis hypogaea]